MLPTSRRILRARAMTSRPAGVIAARLLPLRVNSCTPSSASSCFSCLLMPGWLVNRRSAADVMFSPLSAIPTRYLSCFSVTRRRPFPSGMKKPRPRSESAASGAYNHLLDRGVNRVGKGLQRPPANISDAISAERHVVVLRSGGAVSCRQESFLMQHLPLFADLKNRPVLVVGGGVVAERRVRCCSRRARRSRRARPRISDPLAELAADGRIVHVAREYRGRAARPLLARRRGDRRSGRQRAGRRRPRKPPAGSATSSTTRSSARSSCPRSSTARRSRSRSARGGHSPVLARWVKGLIEAWLPSGSARSPSWRAAGASACASACPTPPSAGTSGNASCPAPWPSMRSRAATTMRSKRSRPSSTAGAATTRRSAARPTSSARAPAAPT